MAVGCAAILAATLGCGRSAAQHTTRSRVTVVARGLEAAWAIAIAPDNRLFVTERPGRIRVVVHDSLQSEPWAVLSVLDGIAGRWETGLMGIALHPQFAQQPFVYVCYTERLNPSTYINRVARLREKSGRGDELTILVDSIPAGPYHDGCRLKIGPDQKLWITTGDAYRNAPAQDSASLAGKILRINLDGSIPPDNPIRGSRMWSMGHRNPQGIAWDPRTGTAFLTEHGSGDIDEINVLEKGANYGWPTVAGAAGKPGFRDPVIVFHSAPTGATFVKRLATDSTSAMVFGSLSGERLIRLEVRGAKARIVDDAVLTGYGRLRDVVEAPDGSLLVTTSNRDGRGNPRDGDDRILRVWVDE